jgi:hypothetical protein
MRTLCSLFLLASLCSASAADEGAAVTMPAPVNISRFIPTGEERRISFVASLFPDCTSRGPIIARVTKAPAHGTVTSVNADSFPNYVATNRLSSCNEKKSPGLDVFYKPEDGYLGADEVTLFLIFPDGTAAEWHYNMMVM